MDRPGCNFPARLFVLLPALAWALVAGCGTRDAPPAGGDPTVRGIQTLPTSFVDCEPRVTRLPLVDVTEGTNRSDPADVERWPLTPLPAEAAPAVERTNGFSGASRGKRTACRGDAWEATSPQPPASSPQPQNQNSLTPRIPPQTVFPAAQYAANPQNASQNASSHTCNQTPDAVDGPSGQTVDIIDADLLDRLNETADQPPACDHDVRGANGNHAAVEDAAETVAAESSELYDLSPLPWADPSVRSREMAAVDLRAASLTQRGYRLAERGALHSARNDFIGAMRLISQALDVQRGTLAHGQALSRGFRAIEEADDFVPRGSRLEADLNVTDIVAGHRTAILKGTDTTRITPLVALERYYSHAQEQLAAAGGTETAASMALHGLGRVQAAIAASDRTHSVARGARAIVMQRAALLVKGNNYMAANELGVLLARYGQLEEARGALLHAIAVSPQPRTWHNLAVVHERLGESELANRARMESLAASRRGSRTDHAALGPAVRWVAPEEFARSNPVPVVPRQPAAAAKSPATETVSRGNGSSTAQRNKTSWFSWFQTR